MVNKTKILVVDDEEIIRELTTSLFTKMGYKVTTTDTGPEAIELFKKAHNNNKPYDVVILDLTLPGEISAKEAMDKLRKIDPKVKAVVTSGYANDAIMANYKKYGFQACVAKPFDIERLRKIIKDLVTDI